VRQRSCLKRQYCLLDVVGAEKGGENRPGSSSLMLFSSPSSCFGSWVAAELGRLFFTPPGAGREKNSHGMRRHKITISDSLPAVNLASCCLLEKNGGKNIYKKRHHLARCALLGAPALPCWQDAESGEFSSTDGLGRLNFNLNQLLSRAGGCL